MHRTFLKRFPLSGFCLPSLRCLVSALTQTQAGGGGLLFRFASSVQSYCGEGWALQAALVVCGEHSPCSGWAARSLALSPRARCAPSLCGPSARRRSGLRKALDRNRGLFAGWEGVASLGLSLPLAPPPASYLQWEWAGSSLEFLSPLVLWTAGGVFWPVNFSLLSHFKKAPSDCSQSLRAGPYPKQCHPLLSVSPLLAGGGCRRLGYLSAGSCL